MNLHSTTRVPADDAYVSVLGKAVYVFAYYEWTIIWIMEYIAPGFVSEYSRAQRPFTSGRVKERYEEILERSADQIRGVKKPELRSCLEEFTELIDRRNALIHAHPITDRNGEQILAFQAHASRPIPDMKWEHKEVEKLIQVFDTAAVNAGGLLDRLRK